MSFCYKLFFKADVALVRTAIRTFRVHRTVSCYFQPFIALWPYLSYIGVVWYAL